MNFATGALLALTGLLLQSDNTLAADPFARLTQTELGLGAFRSANGRPAENYWQQQVDYKLAAKLNPITNHLEGSAEVAYHNRSPDALRHLFFSLDHNALRLDSLASARLQATGTERSQARLSARAKATGFSMEKIVGADGAPLQWQVRDSFLQITLPHALAPGKSFALSMHWNLPLLDKTRTGSRSGFEELPDGSPIYVAAQWFPRAAAYTDYAGWQLKPFLQQGEFSTEFGDYQVTVEVPAHFTVAASGALQNPHEVLSPAQQTLWHGKSTEAAHLVDRASADKRRKQPLEQGESRLWHFSGKQLRDFAFSASPAFLWQMRTDANGRRLQQFYPAEAAPLWQRFGLDAIDHTLTQFDQAFFPLDYRSISIVNAAGIGMEYPGLATVSTRPERLEHSKQKPAWDALTKYDFIGTVIHEVGHNYLPMQINTDEREWAWLDEGLVSFLEYQAEHSWEPGFDVIYGEPRSITQYMMGPDHQPIMTSADALRRKIDNAYNKTASILNVLRYQVLGPQTFDPALKQFAVDWKGKRPTPGDFFRAMETHAATDLSWFWRAWFLSNATLDIAIRAVELDNNELKISPLETVAPPPIAMTAGAIDDFRVDTSPELKDVYTQPHQPPEPAALNLPIAESGALSRLAVTLENLGTGLLPISIELLSSNDSRYQFDVPVHSWMRAKNGLLKVDIPVPSEISFTGMCLDALWLTPDIDRNNNCVEFTSP